MNSFCFSCRSETGTSVLVCSRGGGGLLKERMEVVADLWAANIKVRRHLVSFIFRFSSMHFITCMTKTLKYVPFSLIRLNSFAH
jgi:hypothetical protein